MPEIIACDPQYCCFKNPAIFRRAGPRYCMLGGLTKLYVFLILALWPNSKADNHILVN